MATTEPQAGARGGLKTGSEQPVRHATRVLGRAAREFALIPTGVVLGFVALAALATAADQAHGGVWTSLRSWIGTVIGAKAASTTLQVVAGGLVTVASITFSMLLLAVQQTASSLSPVVFDQFVRRKANQAFLGYFVGLAVFAYVTLAAVQDSTPPILGAAIATVMTVVAMLVLLVLVYSTVAQMQPANVIRMIHDRTLAARERQLPLIARTRRAEQSSDPVSATYCSSLDGYVNSIDLDHLATALARVPNAEIRLHVSLGTYLTYGQRVATVRDDDEDVARRLSDEVRRAVLVSERRDLDTDPTTGLDDLANIAWTNTSTARHNPEIARQALDALRDIAARWFRPATDEEASARLSIVYSDDVPDRLLEAIGSLVVAAHESHQSQTAARVVETYALLLGIADHAMKARLLDELGAVRPLLDELKPTPGLRRARETLARASSSCMTELTGDTALRDSVLRDSALRDSVLRDSVLRDQ